MLFGGFRELAVAVSQYLRIITVSLPSRIPQPIRCVRNLGMPPLERLASDRMCKVTVENSNMGGTAVIIVPGAMALGIFYVCQAWH